MEVKIIADSTCDLSNALLEKYQVAVTPLSVILGEKSGLDGEEITPSHIEAYVSSTGKMPKTSAVNVNDYLNIFKKYRNAGYAVVQLCLSGCMSSCYKNACMAAEQLEHVHVVDTRNLSTGSGLMVLRAAEMAAQGMDAAAIAEACRQIAEKVEASFVVDCLDYLYKGGRCSALASFGANLLHIKPCIEVLSGKMEPGEKFRGPMNHVLEKYVENRLSGRDDIDLSRIFVTHTRCAPETVALVKDCIQKYQPNFQELLETDAGSVITSHCGPGTLGILFIRK